MSLQESFACLLSDDTPDKPRSGVHVHRRQHKPTDHRIGRYGTSVSDVVSTIEHGNQLHIMSMGEYGAAAILRQLADQIGPADVYMGTYNVSMQRGWVDDLLIPRRAGLFRSLTLLFDASNQSHAADSLRDLSDVYGSDMVARIGKCHSKVYAAINDEWAVVVESSSNITGKARTEFYVVSEDRDLGAFHRDWIEDGIASGEVPLCLL